MSPSHWEVSSARRHGCENPDGAGKPSKGSLQGSNPIASVVASDSDSRVLPHDTRLWSRLAPVPVVRMWDGHLEALATVGRQVLQISRSPARIPAPFSQLFASRMTPSIISTFFIGRFDEERPMRLFQGSTASTGSFAPAKLLPPVPSSRHLLNYCRCHGIDDPSRASCS